MCQRSKIFERKTKQYRMEKIFRADSICTAPPTILSRNLCQPIYYEKVKINNSELQS
jgi:hypothetical protein